MDTSDEQEKYLTYFINKLLDYLIRSDIRHFFSDEEVRKRAVDATSCYLTHIEALDTPAYALERACEVLFAGFVAEENIHF